MSRFPVSRSPYPSPSPPPTLDVPPPWGTSFDVRDTLKTLRSEAIRDHLAATAPVHAQALRRERQRGMATGALGGAAAVLLAWFAAVMLASPEPRPKPNPLAASAAAEAQADIPAAVAAEAPLAPPEPFAPSLAESASPQAAPSAIDEPMIMDPRDRVRVRESRALGMVALPDAHAAPRTQAVALAAPPSRRPRAAPVLAAPAAYASSILHPRAEAGDPPLPPAPDIDLRPNAVAFLPPEMGFELPGHARLIDN